MQIVDAANQIQFDWHQMRAKALQLRLVLHFSLDRMKGGITRIVNGLPETPRPIEENK